MISASRPEFLSFTGFTKARFKFGADPTADQLMQNPHLSNNILVIAAAREAGETRSFINEQSTAQVPSNEIQESQILLKAQEAHLNSLI